MSAHSSMPPTIHEPHLLRFRLRQLLLVITLVAIICTLVVSADGPWPMIVIVTCLAITGHVVGNLIGTRLRDTSEEVQRWRASDPRFAGDQPRATPLPCSATLPEETNLAEFRGAIRGFKLLLIAGLVFGALVGGTLLNLTIGNRISAAGWAVATLSSGVMGGWIAFLAVSFTTIARDALRQAHRNERRPRVGRQ